MKQLLYKIIAAFYMFQSALTVKGQACSSIHQFTATGIDGTSIDFSSFKDKKILIVNTASECGLTPQFKQLQELYDRYKDKNFTIIGFPTNDFAHQDPGNNSEIKLFCEKNFGVTFLMMEKIKVKGDSVHPIYKWLTSKKENGVINSSVKWNFQKYMINEEGCLVDVVYPWRKPTCRKIVKWIEQ